MGRVTNTRAPSHKHRPHCFNSIHDHEHYSTLSALYPTSLPPFTDALLVQETLFGRTVTPAERLRQHQRSLTKATRELDRERSKLEQSEKKLIADIKKSAKAGQMVRHFAYSPNPTPLLT